MSEREDRNHERRFNPLRGDMWEEMMCWVIIVLEVHEDHVVVCRQKVEHRDYTWSWDYEKTQVMTRQEFAMWPTYGGVNSRFPEGDPMNHRCWCSVRKEPMTSEADYWDSLKKVTKGSIRDNYR